MRSDAIEPSGDLTAENARLRERVQALEEQIRGLENRALPQLYFSISQLETFFGFSDSTIRTWLKEGKFGPLENCLQIGKDIRVPWSGYDFFRRNNPMVYSAPIKARNIAEMRRKLGKEAVQTPG